MPLEILSVGLLGILILGIFVPYWLKTKDLKKSAQKISHLMATGHSYQKEIFIIDGITLSKKMAKPLSWSMVFQLLALSGMVFLMDS